MKIELSKNSLLYHNDLCTSVVSMSFYGRSGYGNRQTRISVGGHKMTSGMAALAGAYKSGCRNGGASSNPLIGNYGNSTYSSYGMESMSSSQGKRYISERSPDVARSSAI